MATAEIQLPSGQTIELDIPAGEDPQIYIPHAVQSIGTQNPSYDPGFVSTMGREASQGLESIKSGASAFATPSTDFTSFLSPTQLLKMLLGAGQVAMSPFTGAGAYLGEQSGEPVRKATEPLGPNISAALGTAVGAPVNLLTQLIGPNAVTKPAMAALRLALSPVKPIIAAEKAISSGQSAEELMNRARALLTGGAGSEGPMQSLGSRIQPKLTNKEAYAFMTPQPGQIAPIMPEIELTNTTKIANETLAKLEGVPKSVQPAKVPKLAGELTQEGQGQSALDEFMNALTSNPSNPTVRPQAGDIQSTIVGRSPENTARSQLLQAQAEIAASGGKMPLDKVQQTLQGIGRIGDTTTDERVSGFADYLYKNLMDDIRASGPTGEQFAKAQAVAYQARAARRVADIVTKYGTQFAPGNTGVIAFDAGKIGNAINSASWLRDALPATQWKEVQQTLEEVFKAGRGIESLPKIIPMSELKYKPGNLLTQHPFVAGSLAAGAGMASGLPHAGLYALGAGAVLAYPRIIFAIAMSPAGRTLLKTLYKTARPTMNDTAQFAALVNFLNAQTQRSFPQGDPNASIPQ